MSGAELLDRLRAMRSSAERLVERATCRHCGYPIYRRQPPPGSPLRPADRAYRAAITDLTAQASLGLQPRRVTRNQSQAAPVVTPTPS
jgi:hypothetical protein